MENYYIKNALSSGEHDFAIIDRMQYPDVDTSWPVLELVSPMLQPQGHLYPWLLPLKEMKAGDWKALMESPEQAPSTQMPPVSCLLLRSDRSVQEVRSQLIRSLHFTDEQYQGHILRYYDPRVLFHLCWMLNPALLTQTFPPQIVSHWTFWLEGNWHSVQFPTHHTSLSGDSRSLPLQQLQRCGLINQVLSRHSSYTDMISREQISRKIDALLAQSVVLGLPTAEDQVAFALHGLGLKNEFWASPKMSVLLRQARNTPDYFHDETRLWDEERWHVMTQR